MKQIFFIILSCLIITLSGCDKKLEEINIDPTKLTPQNMQFNYLFTSAELSTASAGIFGSSLIYSSAMIQHLSSTWLGWWGDKYIYNARDNGDFWEAQYSSSIKTIVDVIENIRKDENKQNLYNISRILKAFLFQRMTDLYGDIPYSEAGLGFINSSTSPKYDLQKDIYAHLLAELEDAAQKLDDTAANTVGEADLFYGGDVAKWKKFAYSEMLRLAMRMSKVAPDSAKKWSEKAMQGGVMESNLDNALCPHNAKGLFNPVSNQVGTILTSTLAADYRLSETFINLLKVTNDPRLPYLATVAKNPGDNRDLGNNDPAIQLGQPNGYDDRGTAEDITNAPHWPGDQNKYSVVNRTTFAREEAPTFILTYAETALLLAEAAQRGWISGGAPGYYNKGVKAAILQLNQAGATISPGEADDYLNAHPYVPANGLEMINTQNWVATFADWNETWCNWRRSGYPQLTEIHYQGSPTIGSIPRRFTYPLEEASVNPQSYKEAVVRLAVAGGDKMTSRVWWDVK
jgi:Starch-binding associating with outer membrane